MQRKELIGESSKSNSVENFIFDNALGNPVVLSEDPVTGDGILGANEIGYNPSTGNVFMNIDGTTVQINGSGSTTTTGVLNYVIDGGGSAITTGIKGDIYLDFAMTITSAILLADQAGSIVVDIWTDTYTNYPPLVADSITSATPPTISAATKYKDVTLSGWTTAIASGNSLRFNVNSCATITRVAVILTYTRTI